MSVSIVPDTRRLSAVVKRIRLSRRVYVLQDVARLFLSKPEGCRVKLAVRSDTDGFALFQCKTCGLAAGSRELVESHAVGAHLNEYFESHDLEGEAPEGEFICVAKCGLSGTLLGPPNHHRYTERVQQINETRFPSLSPEEYRSHIETIRDEEAIAQWKEESRTRTVYRRKTGAKTEDGDGGEGLSWLEARTLLATEILPARIVRAKRTVMPAPLALQMQDRSLLVPVRDAWRREERSPRSILFALKAAFRHMGLHVFRDQDGREVVWSQQPSLLDKSHAVPSIRQILEFVEQNPGCRREQVLEHVVPGDEEKADLPSEMSWLVEKGHLLEYADGALVCPRPDVAPENPQ